MPLGGQKLCDSAHTLIYLLRKEETHSQLRVGHSFDFTKLCTNNKCSYATRSKTRNLVARERIQRRSNDDDAGNYWHTNTSVLPIDEQTIQILFSKEQRGEKIEH